MAKFSNSNSLPSTRPTSKRWGKCPKCGVTNFSREKTLGGGFRWDMIFTCRWCGYIYEINIKECNDEL